MKAIIIDLDGTLCDVAHRLHFVQQEPKDWSAFFDACVDDTPNAAVATLIGMAYESGIAVIYVSGRPDSHRAQTEAWLEQYGLSAHIELLMRAEGDYRPDDVIKRELYARRIAGQYTVLFTVDDRDQVVKMWRSLGLTCFQVAEGNF